MAAKLTVDTCLVESNKPLWDKERKAIVAVCHRQTSANFPWKLCLMMYTTDRLLVSKSLRNPGCLLWAGSAHIA